MNNDNVVSSASRHKIIHFTCFAGARTHNACPHAHIHWKNASTRLSKRCCASSGELGFQVQVLSTQLNLSYGLRRSCGQWLISVPRGVLYHAPKYRTDGPLYFVSTRTWAYSETVRFFLKHTRTYRNLQNYGNHTKSSE